jgi:hypothetical protein
MFSSLFRRTPIRIGFVRGAGPNGDALPLIAQSLVHQLNSSDDTLECSTSMCDSLTSADIIGQLKSKSIDMGIVHGGTLLSSFNSPSASIIRIVSTVFSCPGLFAVRAQHGAQSLGDLLRSDLQRCILIGTHDQALIGRQVATAAGFRNLSSCDNSKSPIEALLGADTATGPVALWTEFDSIGGSAQSASLFRLYQSLSQIKFLAPSSELAVKISYSNQLLRLSKITVPTSDGPRQLLGVGTSTFLVCRSELDEAIVYRVVRALNEASTVLNQKSQCSMSAQHTQAAIDSAFLHNGTRNYFKELRLL